MNHNLNLNEAAAETISAASADITRALTALHRLLDVAMPGATDLSIQLRAYLGTISEAQFRIDTIVFEPSIAVDSDYAIGEGNDPRGVVRPAINGDDIVNLLDEGVIDMHEFHIELDKRGIDQRHPCIQPGCEHTVPFDDEPYCFTHSPDEGSSVRGYSYLIYARRAQQTADSVDNFIM